MSNEENPDVIWSMENNSKGETVLTVYGVPIGSPQELAALVRDARRFRKLAARYCDDASGRPAHGSIQLERWDAEWMDWVPLSNQPLAEIADALPEVEQ